MASLLARASAVWIGFFVLAFVNGALREVGLKSGLGIGEPLAHQLSCLTGVILWTACGWLTWAWLGIRTAKEAALVGVYWFIGTVLAETFLINRLMSRLTWEQIIQSYNLAHGELWILVLIWLGLMPALIYRIKKSAR